MKHRILPSGLAFKPSANVGLYFPTYTAARKALSELRRKYPRAGYVRERVA